VNIACRILCHELYEEEKKKRKKKKKKKKKKPLG
jgi:hypothetical protein